MTSPLSPPSPPRAVRSATIVHGAMMAGVALFLVVTWWVHRTTPPIGDADLGGITRHLGWAVVAAAFIAMRLLPRPDPVSVVSGDPVTWLRGAMPRLIIRWAVADGAALTNAVMWFINREPGSLAGAVVGLGLLFLERPARYLE